MTIHPTLARAATLATLLAGAVALAGCSAQARAESCEQKAEELRAKQDDGILDPFDIRRLRSQGCLNVSAFG